MYGQLDQHASLEDLAGERVVARAAVVAGKSTLTSRLQRKARGAGEVGDPAAALAGLGGGSGAGLAPATRERFEASLGADLSGVRLHTGADSASAAEALGARAFTTGQDIHFAAGQYQPDDPYGMHLLAHEVAHTVQQGAGGAPQAKLEVSSPGDALEHEADHAADAMVRGAPAAVSAGRASGTVHRALASGAGGASGTGGAGGASGGTVEQATASGDGGKLGPEEIQGTIGAAIPGWSKQLGRDLVVTVAFAVGTSGAPTKVDIRSSIPADDFQGRDLVRALFAQLRFPAPKPNEQGEARPAEGLSVQFLVPRPT